MPSSSPTVRRATVLALAASIAMSAVEATVVSTAMPTVVAELGGIGSYAWVGAIYMIASTISMPVYGKVADLYGRRPTLIAGIAVFLVGSLASGAATSMTILVIARGFQGLGAGAMQPIAMTIVGDLYSLEERGRVVALFGTVWGISGIAGGLLGGLIVATIGWRWVFWFNVPIGALSVAMLVRNYREPPRTRALVTFDWIGASTLACASISLLLGASRESPGLTIPLGLVLVGAFVLWERRAASPVLPLSLIARRVHAIASAVSSLQGATMMATLMFVPLFAQGVLGASAPQAGATLAPMLVGWPIAAAATSRVLPRIGFRVPVIAGSVVVAGALATLAWLANVGANLWALRVAMLVYGAGMGFTLTAQVFAVQSDVGTGERGVATATNLFARSMGGALGVGALGVVFASALRDRVPPETVTGLLDPHRRAGLVLDHLQDALASALTPVFVTSALLGVVALVVSSMFPRDRRSSGG